ncbi:tetratricopeptide repeat protein [Tardiphaga sp. 813_E8_N1_3]|uniref:tetratricopeptide repeat protein n=1 Tax=Tardiphaga sp. 813_E8_N1_3 TaxID=3240760 RepID=UPI003F27D525
MTCRVSYMGSVLRVISVVFVLCCVALDRAWPAVNEPAAAVPVDPALCVAAVASGDDEKILAVCSTLIDNEKTDRPDRLKALIARAGVYTRKEETDRAIADYDAALRLDPTQAVLFNARGELWRKKGDRPRAVRDFGAAIKLDPQLDVARVNYKALAQEIERIGVEMSVKPQPKAPLK